MTSASLPVHAARDARRTWSIGGMLLLASVVIGAASVPDGLLLRKLVFAAAVLVFALGIRGAGSVTNRRPLGTCALVLLALWTFVMAVLTNIVFHVDVTSDWLLRFGLIASVAQFALALVAVTQIARADVVPRPWNRAPAWALLIVSVPWLIAQVLGLVAPSIALVVARISVSVDGLILTGVPIFLGVVAIVLADRLAPDAGMPSP